MPSPRQRPRHGPRNAGIRTSLSCCVRTAQGDVLCTTNGTESVFAPTQGRVKKTLRRERHLDSRPPHPPIPFALPSLFCRRASQRKKGPWRGKPMFGRPIGVGNLSGNVKRRREPFPATPDPPRREAPLSRAPPTLLLQRSPASIFGFWIPDLFNKDAQDIQDGERASVECQRNRIDRRSSTLDL
jgi:hypothetical protein